MRHPLVRSIFYRLAVPLLLLSIAASPALAQFGQAADAKGPKLDKESVQHYEFGIEVTAESGPCKNLLATTPVPIDWPEQRVRVMKEDISPFVKNITYRPVGKMSKQMVISVPYIPAGETVRAVVTLEISRYSLLPPENTSSYVVPKKLDRDTRLLLAPSPKIESRHPKIKSLAKEITADKNGAWEKVEAIYDWVREHVEYKNGPLKGAMAALKDGTGDCEELTSLFIALCRAERYSGPHGLGPRPLLSRVLSGGRRGQGTLVPLPGGGHALFRRHPRSEADPAEGGQHQRA